MCLSDSRPERLMGLESVAITAVLRFDCCWSVAHSYVQLASSVAVAVVATQPCSCSASLEEADRMEQYPACSAWSLCD